MKKNPLWLNARPMILPLPRRGGEGRGEGETLQSRYASAKALLAILAFTMIHPAAGWACSACYGASDSAMAQGMNWGILSLLGVVVTVLGGITTGFVFLAKRAATLSAAKGSQTPAGASPAPTGKEATETVPH